MAKTIQRSDIDNTTSALKPQSYPNKSRHKTGTSIAIAGVPLVAGFLAKKAFQKLTRTNLKDKVIIITGGSRGLGLAIAMELADKKAKLVLCARNADQLGKAQQTLLNKGCEVLTIQADLTKEEDALKVISEAKGHFGRIDILINNAGMMIV